MFIGYTLVSRKAVVGISENTHLQKKVMDLTDQELCDAMEEFERTIDEVSDSFLSLLENR